MTRPFAFMTLLMPTTLPYFHREIEDCCQPDSPSGGSPRSGLTALSRFCIISPSSLTRMLGLVTGTRIYAYGILFSCVSPAVHDCVCTARLRLSVALVTFDQPA